MNRCWRARIGKWRRCAALLFGVIGLNIAQAQDAVRGAGLYLQLPDGLASCVSCHGPDPAGNRNNLLRAAGQPVVLLKALNAIGVMGYLKGVLSDADIADLAAYLNTVAQAASDPQLSAWPRTLEFGALGLGTASPTHTVWLRNLSLQPLTGVAPRVAGARFQANHDCPAVLAAGAGCSVTLRTWAPAPGGQQVDALVWGAASPAVIGLSARGISAAVALLSNNATVLDFGSAEVGTVVVRSLTLLNAGTADAMLGVSTFTGPTAGAFSTNGGCASGTVLMPGTSCSVDLRWRAGAPASYEAALQWRSDGTNPVAVRLQAVGTAASAPAAPPAGPPAVPAPDPVVVEAGGGGCSGSGSDARADSGTALWAACAGVALLARRRRRGG